MGNPVEVVARDLPAELPPDLALCLYRITQEALRNVARHASATCVEVELRCEDGRLDLTVTDDGRGFDVARGHGSLGLAGMREPARLVGAELRIVSSPTQTPAQERRSAFPRVCRRSAMSRPRVLLADDHVMVAEGLKRLLEADFDLLGVVEDGRALVAAARMLEPDVVVADISMPYLNGLEAIGRLSGTTPISRSWC